MHPKGSPRDPKYRILSATCPESLRSNLESDLDFAYHALRKDLRDLMRHVIKLSDAFQQINNGAPKFLKKLSNRRRKRRRTKDDDIFTGSPRGPKKSQNEIPIFLYEPHHAKGCRLLIKNCTACPNDKKSVLLKAHTKKPTKMSAAKSIRGHKTEAEKYKSS